MDVSDQELEEITRRKQAFREIETFIFCDESKYSLKDNDPENAIYYFGVAMSRQDARNVQLDLDALYAKHKLQVTTFHASEVFKRKNTRKLLNEDICKLILKYRLHCFCFKYDVSLLYEPAKILNRFNRKGLINFEDKEFQALFFFATTLNTYLRDRAPQLLKQKILMFFDRNVYGRTENDEFKFPDAEDWMIEQMAATNKENLKPLALPDYLGFIFRKSKLSQNTFDHLNPSLETSPLVIQCYTSVLTILQAKLFHFLDIDEYLAVLS